MSLLATSALRALLLLGTPFTSPDASTDAAGQVAVTSTVAQQAPSAPELDRVTLLLGTDVGYDTDPFRTQSSGALSRATFQRGGFTGGTLGFLDASPFGENGPFAQVMGMYRRDVQPGSRANNTVLAQPLVGWKLQEGSATGSLSYAYQGLFLDGEPLLRTHRVTLNVGLTFAKTELKLEASTRREVIQLDAQTRFPGVGHAGQFSWGGAAGGGAFAVLYRFEHYDMPTFFSRQVDHGPAFRFRSRLGSSFSMGGELAALLRTYVSEGAVTGAGHVFSGSLYGDFESTSALSFRLGVQLMQGPADATASFYRRYAVTLGASYFTGLL